MENIKALIGQRIKELRKIRGYTQEEFSEIVGIDQRTLSAIECGVNFPTRNLVKIAQAFRVEIKDLFDFNHMKLNSKLKKKAIVTSLDKLNEHDTDIIYRLIKSMT